MDTQMRAKALRYSLFWTALLLIAVLVRLALAKMGLLPMTGIYPHVSLPWMTIYDNCKIALVIGPCIGCAEVFLQIWWEKRRKTWDK